ncbi:LacI family DNA-binding transcriptional regulator [Lentzea albidocapillata]|uniref:Phage integrase, N-terminal SAM-like domain n=1 Tax=Lentzea albidocapillata TaxID=40571 RepID=A0A1W2FRF3_9PSEU|nr:LacI family DNA-binding transcriptional regulator [Lentzea albidocapillata]SMD24188.1 Phage integrase, N-terminal SAM-like domain [Lentzea albidocapillata]
MGYAEKRTGKDGVYYRARYKIATGKYGTVQDATGATIKYRTKRDAEQAADDEEAKVRGGTWRDPATGKVPFEDYASRWYAAQDLALSTMETYKSNLEVHLIPFFGEMEIGAISAFDIAEWEKEERAAGWAPSSVKGWRSNLHLILADAVDDGLRDTNPATRRRGRGKRAGRAKERGPEKVITDPLGTLLIAERAALLSGRDDEFVAIVTKYYTGMRWGEIVGLETEYRRLRSIRVEWQLYELDSSELHRCPPKDDSYRDIDTPAFLSRLLSDHIARTGPTPCTCHGRTYVFKGLGAANGAARRPGAKLVDVARRAGVSTGTVSNVLNHPDRVAEETLRQVRSAIAELGFVRGAAAGETAPHWRRNGFATWLFQPAATGWYPKKAPHDAHPVPVLAEPWPGVPARGRNASGRADSCWMPIAKGLTPHGMRHSHKTLMRGLGTPPPLMDDRLGHLDGSVQARYDHVTREMRDRLLDGLTAAWEASLDARLALCPRSPVAVLDELLRARARKVSEPHRGVLGIAR